jgi:hypothetical protein
MAETLNSDGSVVLIEALFWRHLVVDVEEFSTVEEASRFLLVGEDDARLSAIGVFVDGECVREGYEAEPPSEHLRQHAQAEYDEFKAREAARG